MSAHTTPNPERAQEPAPDWRRGIGAVSEIERRLVAIIDYPGLPPFVTAALERIGMETIAPTLRRDGLPPDSRWPILARLNWPRPDEVPSGEPEPFDVTVPRATPRMEAEGIMFNSDMGLILDGCAYTTFSRQEAAVFQVLAARFPRVVSKRDLLDIVWEEEDPEIGPRALDVKICRMRRRLKQAGIRECIATVYARGVQLTVPVELVPAPPKQREVVFTGPGITHLRELLRRCGDRPADAELAEQVRQAAAWGARS